MTENFGQKIIDFVRRIELTRTILMPRFSNFLRNSIIYLRMFFYLETCFLRVTVKLLCRLQDASQLHFSGDELVRPCNRHSNETVTLKKHVTKYKNMRKWMLEFLGKFENRGIKIARFLSPNLSIFSYLLSIFCTVLGVRCDVDIFKLTSSAHSIYREVNA